MKTPARPSLLERIRRIFADATTSARPTRPPENFLQKLENQAAVLLRLLRWASAKVVLYALILALGHYGLQQILADVIWTNPITDSNPSLTNPYTAGQTVDANITVSGIGRGTGITAASATNRYSANGWNSTSLDLNDYYTFTLTPNAGFAINFSSFVYTGQASGTGPTAFAIRSSLDAFATNLATPGATGTTLTLSDVSFQNVTSAITFRIYGSNASSSAGTFSVNDFTFNGTVASTTVTGPTGYFWIGNDLTLGGDGTWDASTTSSWSASSSTIAATTWDSTKTANFGGTAGAVTVSGTVNVGAGISFSTDGYTLSGGTLNFTGASAVDNTIAVGTGTATINSALTGTNGLTKGGTGKLVLTGNGTGLSGGITLAAGTLAINSLAPLGTNTLTFKAGTITSSDATAYTISNPLVFAGDIGVGEPSTGNLTFAGAIDLGAATRNITVATGVTTTISGTTSNGGISKGGAGALNFSVTNSLTALAISGGTMSIDAGTTLMLTASPVASSGGALTVNGTLLYTGLGNWTAPGGTITIADGGTYIHNTGAGLSAALTANFINATGSNFIYRDAATPSFSGRTYFNLGFETATSWSSGNASGSGILTVNGNLNVGANVTINFAPSITLTTNYNGNVTIDGSYGATGGARSMTIASGKTLALNSTGTLTIAPGQVLTINGSATIAGFLAGGSTVVNGSLLLSGSMEDIAVSVANGATLSTDAAASIITAAASNVDVAGNLAPGGSNAGTDAGTLSLTLGTGGKLIFAAGSNLRFGLGTTSDLITFATADDWLGGSGTPTLQLDVTLAGFSYTNTYTLFENVTTDGFVFAAITGYDTGTYTANVARVANNYQISFNQVPEPSAALSLAIGASLVTGFRRRRADRK